MEVSGEKSQVVAGEELVVMKRQVVGEVAMLFNTGYRACGLVGN